jgi:GNAT superfamily N-acetyltransferase
MRIEDERIDYRRADADDIDILVALRVRFLGELYDRPEDDDTEVLRRALQGYLSEAIPANDFIAWLAEVDGRAIGTGGMVVWQMPARYGGLESGRLGYVLNMYTILEARGKGVCTRLLDELIKEARSLGLKYLHLHSSEDGIDIYRRAGFAELDQIELAFRLE